MKQGKERFGEIFTASFERRKPRNDVIRIRLEGRSWMT